MNGDFMNEELINRNRNINRDYWKLSGGLEGSY
jgi:hypothetical protein